MRSCNVAVEYQWTFLPPSLGWMLVSYNKTTWCHNPENDSNLQCRWRNRIILFSPNCSLKYKLHSTEQGIPWSSLWAILY